MSKKSAAGSKRQARERLRAERARQAEIAKRRDRIVKAVIVGVVVLALGGIGGVVWWQSSQTTPEVPPSNVAWGYEAGEGEPGMSDGIGTGEADAPVVVEIYEDFLCPACEAFELDAASVIEEFRQAGTARFVYYPVTLPQFGEPTVRAANAYACAVDEGVGQEFHDALYQNAGTQWNDDQLLELGTTVGAESSTFESCVNDGKYDPWVHSIDGANARRQIERTPTVYVNGEPLATAEQGENSGASLRIKIEQALEDAGADGGGGDGGEDGAGDDAGDGGGGSE